MYSLIETGEQHLVTRCGPIRPWRNPLSATPRWRPNILRRSERRFLPTENIELCKRNDREASFFISSISHTEALSRSRQLWPSTRYPRPASLQRFLFFRPGILAERKHCSASVSRRSASALLALRRYLGGSSAIFRNSVTLSETANSRSHRFSACNSLMGAFVINSVPRGKIARLLGNGGQLSAGPIPEFGVFHICGVWL